MCHENLIEQLIRSRAWVDFSQGLDIRLVNRDNVSLLNRVRIKAVHFAWDNPENNLFRVGNGYRVFGIGVRKDAAFIYKVVPPLCVPPFHRMPLCFMIRG